MTFESQAGRILEWTSCNSCIDPLDNTGVAQIGVALRDAAT